MADALENLRRIIEKAEANSLTGNPVHDRLLHLGPVTEDLMDAFDSLVEKIGEEHPALMGEGKYTPGTTLFAAVQELYAEGAGEFFPLFERFCLQCWDSLTERMFKPVAEIIILLRGDAEPVIEGFIRNHRNSDLEKEHIQQTYGAVRRLLGQRTVTGDSPEPIHSAFIP